MYNTLHKIKQDLYQSDEYTQYSRMNGFFAEADQDAEKCGEWNRTVTTTVYIIIIICATRAYRILEMAETMRQLFQDGHGKAKFSSALDVSVVTSHSRYVSMVPRWTLQYRCAEESYYTSYYKKIDEASIIHNSHHDHDGGDGEVVVESDDSSSEGEDGISYHYIGGGGIRKKMRKNADGRKVAKRRRRRERKGVKPEPVVLPSQKLMIESIVIRYELVSLREKALKNYHNTMLHSCLYYPFTDFGVQRENIDKGVESKVMQACTRARSRRIIIALTTQKSQRGNWRSPHVYNRHGLVKILITINNHLQVIDMTLPQDRYTMLQRLYDTMGAKERTMLITPELFEGKVSCVRAKKFLSFHNCVHTMLVMTIMIYLQNAANIMCSTPRCPTRPTCRSLSIHPRLKPPCKWSLYSSVHSKTPCTPTAFCRLTPFPASTSMAM